MADINLITQDFEAFNEIDEQPRWLPFVFKSGKNTSKLGKVPYNGYGNVAPGAKSWLTLAEALAIKERENLPGVTLDMTGGITDQTGEWQLVGMDFDSVEFACDTSATIELLERLATYIEYSPSLTGFRGFAWVRRRDLDGLADNPSARIDGCHQCELYIGSADRHLTATGRHLNGEPIRRLDAEQTALLVRYLKNATPVPAAAPPLVPGTPFKPTTRTENQRRMLTGERLLGQGNETVFGLLRDWLKHHSREDTLATVLASKLWPVYYLSKRGNEAKALARAEEDIKNADSANKAEKSQMDTIYGQFKHDAGDSQPPLKKSEFAPYLSELWDESLEIEWMIRDYLECDSMAEIWGPSGTYKTFVALDTAVSVASGVDWHGHAVERTGVVLYICGEGRRGINRRLKAVCQKRGVGRTTKIRVSRMPVLLSQESAANYLREEIAKFDEPPVLIIVDTLARNFGGNENSAEDMGLFIDHIDLVRRECNATALIIHHCGHDGTHARGSYALHAGVDTEYKTIKAKGSNQLQLYNEKMKNDDDGFSFFFIGEVVQLLNSDGSLATDKKGNPVDTIVLQTDAAQRTNDMAAFFERYPKLAGTGGKSKFAERFPKVLLKLHDAPGASKDALCKACDVKPGAGLDPLLTQMRIDGLVDVQGMRLTEEGEKSARLFNSDCKDGKGRADMAFAYHDARAALL